MNKAILTQMIAICQAVYTSNYQTLAKAGYQSVCTLNELTKLLDDNKIKFYYEDTIHTITVDVFSCKIKENSCFDVLKSFTKIEKLPKGFEFTVPADENIISPSEQKIDIKKLYKFADAKSWNKRYSLVHYNAQINYVYCTSGSVLKAIKTKVSENKTTDIYGKEIKDCSPLEIGFILPENNNLYKINLPNSIKKTLKTNIKNKKVKIILGKDKIKLTFSDFEVSDIIFNVKNEIIGELNYTTKIISQVLSEKGDIYVSDKCFMYVIDGLNFSLSTCNVDSVIDYSSLQNSEKYVHVPDATVADATVADATVADATVADATVADATVADATVADATVADAPKRTIYTPPRKKNTRHNIPPPRKKIYSIIPPPRKKNRKDI